MTREEALIITKGYLYDSLDWIKTVEIIEALEQEPKMGHWILEIEDWNKWTCSECGFRERTDIHVTLGYHFCPNCGVKMEKEVDE